MKKNENMNSDSIKSLKEFNKKQIQTNIKLHLFFLGMIAVIDVCLFNFILMYKSQISEIKQKSLDRKSSINSGQTDIITQQNSIEHKLVNIFAISINIYGNIHFSLLFEKSEEVSMVKNFMSHFTRIENQELLLIYQGSNDSDDSRILLNIIQYFNNLLIIIGTKEGNKFGFFFEDTIAPNSKGYFSSESDRCFIFSFQNKEKYECLNNGINFEVNKNNLFNIGDGDIIINHNFMTNGGIINYPFKSFDISEIENNAFIENNGKIDIFDIEIYGGVFSN